MDGEEPTQATQNVLDPRRLGKQNSGFSDEAVSDIICVLYPHTEAARQEVQALAQLDCPHVIGRDEADVVEPDYDLEDHASRFDTNPIGNGNYAIILRLSSHVKSPAAGFAFGRNSSRCDVVFSNDPHKRVSNIHFRIYVNEYGNVMIEDQSTNGTFVDRHLLTAKPKDNSKAPVTRWVLSSGSVITIYLHNEQSDLTFRVRIPRRDDEYDRTYINKVDAYFARHGLKAGAAAPAPTNKGPPDIFKTPAEPVVVKRVDLAPVDPKSPSKRKDGQVRREWTGSGKYNKVGTIGKGAFAVVYKVTSKYDGKPYAAKELEKRRFVKNGVLDQKVDNEMKIMQRAQHPNIVRYIENFDWDDRLLIIIMEYVSEGDLGKHIADYGPFSEDVTKSISQQLLSALGYLHANNITHRDVKPDNILISALEPAVEVKLTDFGLSKIVDTEQTFLRTFCGTLLYCAPEVYTEYAEYDDSGNRTRGQKVRRMPGQRYSHAVDIWSLGGVIFYTLTGSPPYPVKSGISHSELLNRIMTTRLNVSPLQREGVSDVGVDFLSRMLQRRPENRATVAELDIHSWMGGPESSINASQSYDEITDDEDLDVHAQIPRYDDDYISESMGEESEKENSDNAGQRHHHQPPPNQRLFGEVGVSAIGSSGVIPDDFLNLPVENDSMGETKIVGYPGDEAYDTADSGTPAGTRTHRRTERQGTISMAQQQSTDQLQSLVMNVASQSLGGSDDSVNEGASSRFVSMDFNASKRKPPSHDTSDEFDENVAPTKPLMKRLKSEGNIDELSEPLIEECKLLACMPQVRRLGSGRQIDGPVNKVSYWEQDRTTWHLNYPEMTQLQHDAFAQAARDRGEQFAPGKTPLWDLAMKHFFPMQRLGDQNSRNEPTRLRATLRRDEGSTLDAMTEFPPTAVPVDQGIIPDSPLPDTQIVVPIQLDAATHRAVGIIESHPFSCIQGISFPITDTLVSFGRGPDNTEAFEPKTEPRVPKYAFKILIWRDGCDPAQEPAKASPPWVRETGYDESAYSFWISTKATLGIRINGHSLPSSDSKNPSGPSRHWTRIFDGDDLVIWGGVEPRNQTSLSFRCFWGASQRPRADKTMAPEMASEVEAEQLDVACQRAEKRIRDGAEKQRRVREAEADFSERSRTVEQERERSRAFEMKRLEAIEFLQAKHIVASRRISPASASAFT